MRPVSTSTQALASVIKSPLLLQRLGLEVILGLARATSPPSRLLRLGLLQWGRRWDPTLAILKSPARARKEDTLPRVVVSQLIMPLLLGKLILSTSISLI